MGLEAALLKHMSSATSKLQVMMYQLTVTSFVDAMIAAHQRGVAVQVLLDAKQNVNATARSRLEVAGVPVKAAPAEFSHAHAKVILADDSSAVVMSANMNDYSISSERNYGVIDRDPADLASLSRVFERDWAGSGPIDLSCTRLLVSPLNARQRLASFISGARQSLSLAVMYVTDDEMEAAIIARAKAGVKVRVLLASPAWISSNTQTAKDLAAEGIPVRFLTTFELHAKLILADGAAFVGSQNLSYNSLQNNREVGLLISEPEPAGAIAARFEADWQAGVAAP
jgi:phosphatidylserine/phosphatidylglycerophosphate/cardiolipin synthase-like enzyme